MAPMRVAEAGHVDAEQLELGRHVGVGELGGAAEQPVGDDLGPGVARADQAVAPAVDRGDLADRVDVRIRCGAGSSASTPPRSPIASPASRASSSRGRTPAAKTTTPASMTRAVAQRHPHESSSATAGGPIASCRSIASVPTPTCTDDAEVGDHPAAAARRRPRRPAGPSAAAPSRRRGPAGRTAQRVGGLQAEQAAADHHAHGQRGRRRSRAHARPRGSRRGRRGCGRRGTPGRSWPGTGGTNAYEPVASTSAS